MNFYWMKCWKFTKNSDIEIKGEIDGKISLYSYCIDCGFKQFETTDYEKISNLLKQCYDIVWSVEKNNRK